MIEASRKVSTALSAGVKSVRKSGSTVSMATYTFVCSNIIVFPLVFPNKISGAGRPVCGQVRPLMRINRILRASELIYVCTLSRCASSETTGGLRSLNRSNSFPIHVLSAGISSCGMTSLLPKINASNLTLVNHP